MNCVVAFSLKYELLHFERIEYDSIAHHFKDS